MEDITGLNQAQAEGVRALANEFPLWQVWIVPHAVGPNMWCARLWQDHRVVLNAYSEGELREYLADHTGDKS